MSSTTPPPSTRGSTAKANSPADKSEADDWDLLASVVSEAPPPAPPSDSSSPGPAAPLISGTPTLSTTPMRVLAGSVPAASSFTASEWRASGLPSSSTSSMSFDQGSPQTASLSFPPPVLVTRSALAANANPAMGSQLIAEDARATVPPTSEQSLSHPGSWQIVLVNNDARQIVLYNRRSHALAIQTAHSPVPSPTHSAAASAPGHSTTAVALSSPPPHDLRHHAHHQHHCCPMCGRAFPVGQLPAPSSNMSASQFGSQDQDDGDAGELGDPMDIDQVNLEGPPSSATSTGVGGGQMVSVAAMPTYQDRDYFRLLANVHSTYPIASSASVASSPPDSPARTSSPDPYAASSVVTDHHHQHHLPSNPPAATTSATPTSPTPGVNSTSFNQGYYSRFFHELGKLGRGAHGAVYLCRHVLDDIPLGEYAIKKVAVGNNHPWLSRLLREVTLLERLRHPNIIAYKHAWLEHAQHSTFGPLVPSLFMLMERANGGNLEDFLLPEGEEAPDSAAAAGGGKAAAVKARKRAARVAALPKLPAAWSEMGAEGGWAVGQHGRIVRVLGIKSVVRLVLGVARGLEHLHKLGVVHRDLKPPNILLSWESDQGIPAGATVTAEGASPGAEAGQDDGVVPQDSVEPGAVPPTNKIPIPLIADFGEFDVISNPTAADRTGNTGTIDFTAPECLKRDHVTGRFLTTYSTKADVWSLGLIALYVAFAGHVPFVHRADVDKLRDEILTCNPTSLVGEMAAAVNPHRVPKAFMALVAQCLSKEPGQRPTAGKVVHVLERMLAQVEGENGAGELAGGPVRDEDPMDVDTELGGDATGADLLAGASTETRGTRRGRSSTFAASGTSTTRSVSAYKTTWDFGDLQPADGESSSTLRNRATRSVSTSGARLRPIPSSAADSSLEPEAPAQAPFPALPPPHAAALATSFNTWIAAGARIAQVAALMAVPSQVPTNISVALTCCALATTEWLSTTTAASAATGPRHEERDQAADRMRTGVLGGLIVHFVTLAGVSWAYASGRAG